MSNKEQSDPEEKIGITIRDAQRAAVNGVKNFYLFPDERELNEHGVLKFKIQNCEEGVTSMGKPAWQVDVASYTVKIPIQPETEENIILQKLYPIQVCREKPPIGRSYIRASIRKGAKIKNLT